MIISKYFGMKSDNWECTHVGVARVQPAYRKKLSAFGKRVRAKSAGHQAYYYIFERLTSDGKAMKMIRLNDKQVKKVSDGKLTVEEIANAKKEAGSRRFINKISYSFQI